MTEESVYRDIGRRIRDAREAKGMTQDEVGRRLGLAGTLVTRIEKGSRKVTIIELQQLASLLEKSLAYFLTGEDAPQPRSLRNSNRQIPPEAQQEIDNFLAYIWQKYAPKDE